MAAQSNVELVEYDIETEFPAFLNSVLDKAQLICEEEFNEAAIEEQMVVVDRAITLIRSVLHSGEFELMSDGEDLDLLSRAFSDVLSFMKDYVAEKSTSPSSVACDLIPETERRTTPGRPPYKISAEVLEDLRAIKFSWNKIAKIMGVSRWTIHRRVQEYGLQNLTAFSTIS